MGRLNIEKERRAPPDGRRSSQPLLVTLPGHRRQLPFRRHRRLNLRLEALQHVKDHPAGWAQIFDEQEVGTVASPTLGQPGACLPQWAVAHRGKPSRLFRRRTVDVMALGAPNKSVAAVPNLLHVFDYQTDRSLCGAIAQCCRSAVADDGFGFSLFDKAQALLPRLKTDLLEIVCACVEGRLDALDIQWSDDASVCVVLASGGYPGAYETGLPISGLDAVDADVEVFHAGTRRSDAGALLTAGGRVLSVVATAPTLAAARAKAYANVERIHFEGVHFRRDIGLQSDI